MKESKGRPLGRECLIQVLVVSQVHTRWMQPQLWKCVYQIQRLASPEVVFLITNPGERPILSIEGGYPWVGGCSNKASWVSRSSKPVSTAPSWPPGSWQVWVPFHASFNILWLWICKPNSKALSIPHCFWSWCLITAIEPMTGMPWYSLLHLC